MFSHGEHRAICWMRHTKIQGGWFQSSRARMAANGLEWVYKAMSLAAAQKKRGGCNMLMLFARLGTVERSLLSR